MKHQLFTRAILFLILCSAAIFVISSTSCSKQKTKIVYLYPSKYFTRFIKEGNFMIEKLKASGYQAEMYDANNDNALQIEQGMKALDEGTSMLIISCVNGNTIAPLVREATSRGVPVIAFNRLINNVEYDLYFTGNNVDNGRLFAESVLKAKPSGKYVVLAGDRFDKNGVEQRVAIDSILKPHIENGDVQLVYETYIENWDKRNAEYEISQVIQTVPDIDVVIAGSDPIADGVINVLKKAGLAGKVLVTGQDADLSAAQSINNGNQFMTIYHPHKVLGYKVAELAIEILKGKKGKDFADSYTYNGLSKIPTIQVKSVLVTKENIEKELVATKEFTWSEINGQ